MNHVANLEDAGPTEGDEFETVLSAGQPKQILNQSRQKDGHMSDKCVPRMKVGGLQTWSKINTRPSFAHHVQVNGQCALSRTNFHATRPLNKCKS